MSLPVQAGASAADIFAIRGLKDALAGFHAPTIDEQVSAEMPRGLPRPRLQVAGYENGPAPYVAGSVSEPGTLDFARSVATDKGFLCAVCGLEVTGSVCGIATGAPADGAQPDDLTIDGDHGLSHETCARMTVAWCPAFTGRPDLSPLVMWLVDTGTLRNEWHRLNDDLTLGLLGPREQVAVPEGARRPWATNGG